MTDKSKGQQVPGGISIARPEHEAPFEAGRGLLLTRDQAAIVYVLCGKELGALEALTVTRAKAAAREAFRRSSDQPAPGVDEYAEQLGVIARGVEAYARIVLNGGARAF